MKFGCRLEHGQPTFRLPPLRTYGYRVGFSKRYLQVTDQSNQKACPSLYSECTIVRYSEKTEVGIYKRKQESKKTRKLELDQECDQVKKKQDPKI